MKKILLFSAILFGLSLSANVSNGQKYDRQGRDVTGENCFAIIAGKNTTVDGSVLFAHNEDDSGEQMLNVYIVPAGTQPAVTDGGLKIPASIANGYTDKHGNRKNHLNGKFFWLEFPGMSVADAAMNQWGVAIASDGCRSREDKDDFTDGGILYDVRMDVAKYATSARDAVRIIVIAQYGEDAAKLAFQYADTFISGQFFVFSCHFSEHN